MLKHFLYKTPPWCVWIPVWNPKIMWWAEATFDKLFTPLSCLVILLFPSVFEVAIVLHTCVLVVFSSFLMKFVMNHLRVSYSLVQLPSIHGQTVLLFVHSWFIFIFITVVDWKSLKMLADALTVVLTITLWENVQGLVTMLLSIVLANNGSPGGTKMFLPAIQLDTIRILQLENMMVWGQVLLIM